MTVVSVEFLFRSTKCKFSFYLLVHSKTCLNDVRLFIFASKQGKNILELHIAYNITLSYFTFSDGNRNLASPISSREAAIKLK